MHFVTFGLFLFIYLDMRSSKPEPGELSPLHSSTSSRKEESLKRDREIQELNDSDEEGDLLEDEDEVRRGDWLRNEDILFYIGTKDVFTSPLCGKEYK